VLWWEGIAWKRKRKGPARTTTTWGFSALGVDASSRVNEVSAPPQSAEKGLQNSSGSRVGMGE